MKTFKEYSFHPRNTGFIEFNGFEKPTPIQRKVIPMALKGKDIIGISSTGTGKTHAFLIPILEKLDPSKDAIQAVITAPTRELATQIFQRLQPITTIDAQIRIKLVTGGIDKQKMMDSLKQQPHIVVGTPGRIKDLFVDESVLRVDTADILVVDEADMTMEFGFLEEVDAIAGRMKDHLQMMVFSATLPEQLRPFIKKYLKHPQHIVIEEAHELSPNIEHVIVPCKHLSYQNALVNMIDGIRPYVCLIFANSRNEATEAAKVLREKGLAVVELHGGLEPRQRKIALKQIQQNAFTYIVASDIAARGIDIDAVTHVVSLGLPSHLEYYVHRAGRTGRAGREGTCYLLYQNKDETNIHVLRKQGINFSHRTYKDGEWRELKPLEGKKISKNDQEERDLAKALTRKNEKVKPGYKKKKNAEIQRIKRKKKREMIQAEIKTQIKERAKAKQRALREENNR